MPAMKMVAGAQFGDGRDARARPRRADHWRGCRLFRRRVSGAPTGCKSKYGERRVLDAPISEGGIVGAAVGMGVYGLRPVVEIQFADYIYPAIDQLVSEAARLRYRSAGEFWAPITVRAPYGGGIFGGQTHSQSPEALFTHVCGLKTVIPSNPYDAKGLLIAAIEDDDPVIFFEPKRLYNGPFDGHPDRPAPSWASHPASEVPEGHYAVPLGKAAVVREGGDVTVLAYGTMVHVALAAAAGDRRRRRGDRSAHAGAARSRHDRRLGQQDRPLRHRPRGDAHLRLSAPNWPRSCRNIASITWKRRSSA